MKNKVKYMVMMNLSGLHRKVYKMNFTGLGDGYWDEEGNVECGEKPYKEDGLSSLVFDSKKEAEIALSGAKMVADFLIERLK